MIKDYTDFGGVARQGDVVIFRLPDSIKVNKTNEIHPVNNKLILLEGEMTGHHHSIDVLERINPVNPVNVSPSKFSSTVEGIMQRAINVVSATANMYNDTQVPENLVKNKILTRTDMFIGVLVVEGGGDIGVVLKHQEHDSIRLTAGNYYIGHQIESYGEEIRKIQD